MCYHCAPFVAVLIALGAESGLEASFAARVVFLMGVSLLSILTMRAKCFRLLLLIIVFREVLLFSFACSESPDSDSSSSSF